VIYALEKSINKREIKLILQKKKKTKNDIKKIIEVTNKAEGSVFVVEKMITLADEANYYLKNIKTNTTIFKILIDVLIPPIIEEEKKALTKDPKV
jgi:hypothetical protein